MLGVIVQHSVEIVTFISWLSPVLYQPQIRRLIRPIASAQVAVCASVLKGQYANFGETTVYYTKRPTADSP